ncbi:Hsp20/alpha crystallin family protein [Streptomyces virginiae]|uniref:Hsp20/alpha crystallin family protein n=1 Tax=Streptomyces virginiae TaxID=1961 RepID=UPI0007C46745|nr:Hsp20/alpha crystallin family protein [Streptomyces virginiae]
MPGTHPERRRSPFPDVFPGMDPDKDIQITVEGDTLTVSAEHTESKEEKDHSEFRYGSSQRAVRVPMPAAPEKSRRSIPVKRTTADGKGESS